ncbi:MAG: mechanosensitive ion channel family protein [Kofleriaceae bacterium]
MEERLRELISIPAIRAAVIIVGSILAAKLIEWMLSRTLVALARRTASALDDQLVDATRRPIFISVVLIGLGWGTDELPLSAGAQGGIHAVLETLAVLIWSGASFRIGALVLGALSKRSFGIVDARTIPVFDMLLKVVVIGTAVYFGFLAWDIDLTAWLASAGIIGIAIGFAAKDTLANLFSGIFIVADAPYKVGDFIVLDGGLRGQVIKIGIRSTRVLTRDDIEVTVPNAVIAASKIVNETGGPDVKQRVRVGVDCAYGSDIDKIRAVLLACPKAAEHISPDPTPEVRFVEFGGSGLRFELRVWISDPAKRGAVIDDLHCRIYKAFQAAGIEIPYSKHDVYIKELPARSSLS